MRYSDQNMRVKRQVYFDITSLSNPQPLRNPTSINPILKKQKLLGCKVKAFLLGLFGIFHQNQAKMIQSYIHPISQDWDDVFSISYLLWGRQASQFMQAKLLCYQRKQKFPHFQDYHHGFYFPELELQQEDCMDELCCLPFLSSSKE